MSIVALLFFSASIAYAETSLETLPLAKPLTAQTVVGPQGSVSIAGLLPDDPVSLLGTALGDIFGRFGLPSHVSAQRGEAAWQDDVVFSYASNYSLYLADDRLWQIRFSAGYSGSVYGVFVGDSSDKVVSTLGTPYYRAEDYIVFRLAYKNYPVRLRVAVASDKVSDIYLYRADF
jgi:hypothetical protein